MISMTEIKDFASVRSFESLVQDTGSMTLALLIKVMSYFDDLQFIFLAVAHIIKYYITLLS